MAGQERSSGWFLDSVPDTMESSMQSDQTADHPLALDAIGSAVVRRATRAGVPVPVTARLVEDSLARTRGPARATGPRAGDP